ncbi:putative pantoate-beta-alanine ligase [Erysiphe necator]|uniref:Pantoate--beta-alanine ligase n=1 Tax=Uncinula necator TaxID=52586 RepID=A0A0B1PDR7_UNCNE|nr:putative pantoate-beta-alanine ligase [Erysiphe necator]
MSLRNFSTSGFARQARCKSPVIPNTSIKIFSRIQSFRQWRRRQIFDHRSVGLVPTMGALHEGHLSLIRLAARKNAAVVVSIYVNPSQFGVSEDLDSYPQTFDKDIQLLRDLDNDLACDGSNFGKIAAVFAPTTSEMYPDNCFSQEIGGNGSFVNIKPLDELLEGTSRPTFFRGVATICTKLFNIVTPDTAYFGQKDIQQTIIIKKMIKDFCIDTEVIVGETQRESDGLALSSRNQYLGTRRRQVATVLIKSLRLIEEEYLKGNRMRDSLLQPALNFIRTIKDEQDRLGEVGVQFLLDYISLADPQTLEEVGEVNEDKGAIISGAIKMLPLDNPSPNEYLGQANGPMVRLIDNIILSPTEN